MSETDREVRRILFHLLDVAEQNRMTGQEQKALVKLIEMVWRWEREDSE